MRVSENRNRAIGGSGIWVTSFGRIAIVFFIVFSLLLVLSPARTALKSSCSDVFFHLTLLAYCPQITARSYLSRQNHGCITNKTMPSKTSLRRVMRSDHAQPEPYGLPVELKNIPAPCHAERERSIRGNRLFNMAYPGCFALAPHDMARGSFFNTMSERIA